MSPNHSTAVHLTISCDDEQLINLKLKALKWQSSALTYLTLPLSFSLCQRRVCVCYGDTLDWDSATAAQKM